MLEVGQVVDGKYRVERLLGKGGMGAVFEGHHLLVGRRVAIKVILPEVMASEEGVARFEREVRAAARIGSDHVLEVFDVGALPDGARFMVSEFLDGETLSGRLKRSPLAAREAALLMLQLLDGLAAAHQAGIVHRDLKPDNIFLLTRKGGHGDFLKIIDFGVSKYQFEDPSTMGMTTTGAVIGTPYYLSPEQARGQRDIDARSDLYTVGVIMYQLVAGEVPIRADTFNELLFKIALEPAPPLSRAVPDVDPQFSLLVERAMAREPKARFQTAGEMRTAIEMWLAVVDQSSASRKMTGAARAFSGAETLAATMPTSSSFGSDALIAPRRVPKALLIVVSLVLLAAVAVGATLLLTHSGGTTAAASASAPAPAAAPAAAPEVAPTVLPTEPAIVLAPTEAPRPVEPAPAAPNQGVIAQALPDPPRPLPRPTAKPARPASAATAEPSTTARKRHDLGY